MGRVLCNLSLVVFLLAVTIVGFGPRPSPPPVEVLFHWIAPVINSAHLASSGRYFSVNPVNPPIGIYTVIDKLGEKKNYLLADRDIHQTFLIFQRYWGMAARLGAPFDDAKLIAESYSRYLCRVHREEAQVIEMRRVSRYSPTPIEAMQGIKSDSPLLLKHWEFLTSVSCGSAE